MRIKKARIIDLKCFDNLELDVPKGRCVLVGKNGSGKSTVLRAIVNVCTLTFQVVDESLAPELKENYFEDRDIRRGQDQMKIELLFEMNEDELRELGEKEFRIRYQHAINGKKAFLTLNSEWTQEERERYIETFYKFAKLLKKGRLIYFDAYRFLAQKNPAGPVLANEKSEEDIFPLLLTNIDRDGKATGKNLELKQWLLNIDYIRLKGTQPRYEILYEHLTKAFDLLLHPLQYQGIDETGTILFYDRENEITIEIDLLSDGCKSIFQIIVGIMRMLFDNAREDELFYMRDGIVLIDEIDCHIHPRWQKSLMPSMLELFPNCQFIVTTHSPYILDSVHDYEIKTMDQRPIV